MTRFLMQVDAKEMEQLLREGAYAVLLEDDTDMVKEFYEQDIDKILEQRSHVIVTDAGSGGPNKGTESWLNKRKKSGHTSKSMFTGESAKEHAEIDVNDPDFWKKVLPDLVTPDLMLERLKDVDAAANDEDAERSELLEKYMKDLSQMMDGMLDLNRRNQLPERERAVCMKLLLRITLKEDSFEEEDREKAQEWLVMRPILLFFALLSCKLGCPSWRELEFVEAVKMFTAQKTSSTATRVVRRQ